MGGFSLRLRSNTSKLTRSISQTIVNFYFEFSFIPYSNSWRHLKIKHIENGVSLIEKINKGQRKRNQKKKKDIGENKI